MAGCKCRWALYIAFLLHCAISSALAFAMSANAAGNSSTKRVLFVCLGNICRSPSAEAVFTSVVDKAGLSDQFEIDSCGTGGGMKKWYTEGGRSYHTGDPADGRMTEAAAERGIKLTSLSRPLK